MAQSIENTVALQANLSQSPRWVDSLRGIRRMRWELVSYGKTHPLIYMPLVGYWSRDVNGNFRGLDRQTELLIDAYPRSANSYATYGFMRCQSQPVRVSHHLHAPAAITYAARHEIPTLTILRDPLDVCASMLSYFPKFGVEQAFKDYLRYYEAVSQSVSKVVIAKFATATSDLGAVIRAVNAKFGTSFTEFPNSPEEVAAVRELLKNQATKRFGDAAIDSGRNSTPSSVSDSGKRSLSEQLDSYTKSSVVADAKELYKQLLPQASL